MDPAALLDVSGWKMGRRSRSGQADGSVGNRFEGDSDLVGACLAGEPGAFDVLVERYSRQLYQLCYRFVGNHEDSSDLVQEVFLRVHRGLHKFKGKSALSTWLYRVGVNVCLSHVSKKRPVLEFIEPERCIDPNSADPVNLVADCEKSASVKLAIARLPEKQRVTLILRVYHELTHKEIAEVLGTSMGAVKTNFFHALQNMKKLLESHTPERRAIERARET